jgi:hypothetical protein
MRGGAITLPAGEAQGLDGLKSHVRIGPRHPRLAAGGFRFARWLAAKTMAAAGFHQLGSEFADARIAFVRDKLARGETSISPASAHPYASQAWRWSSDAGPWATAARQ